MPHLPRKIHFNKRFNYQGSQTGFTLLELVVVIVIIGILFTYTVLAIRGNSPEDLIKEEAYRLERLIELALEEAILRGEEYALELHVSSYRFLHRNNLTGEWQAVQHDNILRARPLPANIIVEMSLEDTDIVIDNNDEDLTEFSLESTYGEAKKEAQFDPQIYLLSSGEITPEFEIRFYIIGVEESYFVRGTFDGNLSTEQSDI